MGDVLYWWQHPGVRALILVVVALCCTGAAVDDYRDTVRFRETAVRVEARVVETMPARQRGDEPRVTVAFETSTGRQVEAVLPRYPTDQRPPDQGELLSVRYDADAPDTELQLAADEPSFAKTWSFGVAALAAITAALWSWTRRGRYSRRAAAERSQLFTNSSGATPPGS